MSLRMEGVGVRIEGTTVLDGVDLDVGPGEWVGLVGPNGAGKTTLLRAVLGAVEVTGRVSIAGLPTEGLGRTDRARLVASVPQRPEVPADMRVIDFVLLGRTPHISYLGKESEHDLSVAHDAIRSLDLVGLSGRVLGSLSGGEVQRAVLARALAQGAPLLLLDEPTSALDVGHAQHVLDLVDHIRRTGTLSVLTALHDLTLAGQFSDRLVMLSRGQTVAEGSPRSVLTESAIRQHYGANVRVFDDGQGIVVIPIRDSRQAGEDASMGATS